MKIRQQRTPRVGLAHELQHSFDADKGILNNFSLSSGVKLREVKAIRTENRIRVKTGDKKSTYYSKKGDIPEYLLIEIKK